MWFIIYKIIMQNKKLERDQESAVLAGVVAGLANYFKQDPLLFRFVAVLVIILTGFFPAVFLYFLAWLFIPKRTTPKADYTIEKE